MTRGWRVSGLYGEIQLSPWHSATVAPRSSAVRERCPVDEIDRFTLIEICEELGLLDGDFSRVATRELREQVGRALDSGRLVARRTERAVTWAGVGPRQREEPPAPEPPAPEPPKETVWVRLDIAPDDAAACDDEFVLEGSGGYRQTRTVADDQIPGDQCIDLEFSDVDPAQSYTLRIVPARARAYPAFSDVPFGALASGRTAGSGATRSEEANHPRAEEVGSEE